MANQAIFIHSFRAMSKLVENAFPDIDLCSFLEQQWWDSVVHLAYELIDLNISE